jgi:MoaA/NifB/PqqE/SkfB family radical SAM enzyme
MDLTRLSPFIIPSTFASGDHMRQLTPNMLTILTTNTCTASCGHCTVHSSPQRRGKLSLNTIVKVIDELHSIGTLQVVVFAGGEPTLMKETLLDSIAHCDMLGITTRVVTNASWATTDYAAKKMIRKLREAGLAELNLSADDFHLPYISFENIKRAWKASKGQGFVNVAIANCAGPNSQITPDYIRQEFEEHDIEVRFDDDGVQTAPTAIRLDGTTYMLSNGLLQRIGRAREHVHDEDLYFPRQADLDRGCPWAIRAAALSPNGHLVACCGIEASGNEVLDFGDTAVYSALELARDANERPMINAISTIGPYRLLQLAKSLDRANTVQVRARYASVCEACEDLVRQPAALAVLERHQSRVAREISAKRKSQEEAT